MTEQVSQETTTSDRPEEHVDRCLSMVMHYEEIQVIAGVIKKVIEDRAHSDQSEEEIKND